MLVYWCANVVKPHPAGHLVVHLQRANAAKPGGPIGGPFLAGRSGGPTLPSLVVQLVVHLLWTIGGPFFSLVVHSSEDNTGTKAGGPFYSDNLVGHLGATGHCYLGGPNQNCWWAIPQKVKFLVGPFLHADWWAI